MVALVLAGAVLIGATAQAIRAGVEGARAQRFLALRDAWTSDGTYYNPLSSTAVVVFASAGCGGCVASLEALGHVYRPEKLPVVVVSPVPVDKDAFDEQINGEPARRLFLLYEAALDTAAVVSADGHVLEAKASGVPLDIFYEEALERFGGAS